MSNQDNKCMVTPPTINKEFKHEKINNALGSLRNITLDLESLLFRIDPSVNETLAEPAPKEDSSLGEVLTDTPEKINSFVMEARELIESISSRLF